MASALFFFMRQVLHFAAAQYVMTRQIMAVVVLRVAGELNILLVARTPRSAILR